MFFNQDALASSIFDGINASYHETAAEIQVRFVQQAWTHWLQPGCRSLSMCWQLPKALQTRTLTRCCASFVVRLV